MENKKIDQIPETLKITKSSSSSGSLRAVYHKTIIKTRSVLSRTNYK